MIEYIIFLLRPVVKIILIEQVFINRKHFMTLQLIVLHIAFVLAPVITISYMEFNYDKNKCDDITGVFFAIFYIIFGFLLPLAIVEEIFKVIKPTDTAIIFYYISVFLIPFLLTFFYKRNN